MSQIQEILEHIHKLRTILHRLIDEAQGNLQDANVISTSRILNSDIIEYYKIYRRT